MFERDLDIERAFGQHGAMARTHVRRRRVALTLTVVLAGLALSGPVAHRLAGSPMEPAARRTYVVRSGDTLWSIAQRMAPGDDPRPLVQRIQVANGVDAGSIAPGQTIVVPLAG